MRMENKKQHPGKYSLKFDAAKFKLNSGLYIVVMQNTDFYEYKKIMYLK